MVFSQEARSLDPSAIISDEIISLRRLVVDEVHVRREPLSRPLVHPVPEPELYRGWASL